jgi:cell division septation protein DedD
MYEDFYPYIPGRLDARKRMKKRLLKRLCYSFGAFIVFGSGFLLGLAWYESPPPQTALQQPRQVKATHMPPVKTSTPFTKLVVPDLKPPPAPPPSEPASLPTFEAQTDENTDNTLTEADASQLPSITPSSEITVPPLPPQDETSDDIHVETVPRPATSQPRQPAPHSRPYLVQIGAFRNEANAHSMVAKLRDKGYQPFIRTVQDRRNLVWHRVFLDRVQDKAQAQATAKAFEASEKMNALVMLSDGLLERGDVQSR